MLLGIKKNITLFIVMVSSFLYCKLAVAIAPTAVDLNGVYFIPTFTISEIYDNNIGAASGNQGDPIQASWLTTLQPKLSLSAIDRLNAYQLNYQLKQSQYHVNDSSDKTEHFVDSSAHMEFTSRHRLNLRSSYSRQQAERDSINRFSLNDEAGNKYYNADVSALYSYGAQAAKMQLDFGIKQGYVRYLNNRYTDSQTHQQDHDTSTGLIRSNYNYSYKTKLFLETEYSEYRYKTSNLSSDTWRYAIGANWKPTSKIFTELKFGLEDKNFIEPNISDTSNNIWAASINWRPIAHSIFTFGTSRKVEEGSATEYYVDIDRFNLSWQHSWSSRVTTEMKYELAYVNYGKVDYNSNARSDDYNKYTISARYNMRSWLGLGLGYKYITNESNFNINNYERNLINFNVDMSL